MYPQGNELSYSLNGLKIQHCCSSGSAQTKISALDTRHSMIYKGTSTLNTKPFVLQPFLGINKTTKYLQAISTLEMGSTACTSSFLMLSLCRSLEVLVRLPVSGWSRVWYLTCQTSSPPSHTSASLSSIAYSQLNSSSGLSSE